MTVAPTLATERLILRAYRDDDFDSYAALWADPEVVRLISGTPSSREDSWSRFLRAYGMWERMGFGFFVVADKESGAYIGEVGFQERKRDLLPSIEGTLEMGWALAPAVQGKGIATEAALAALAWADEAHRGKRFTALIDGTNAASIRVAEKSGFRHFADTVYHGVAARLYER